MAPALNPIDYAAVRRALVAAISVGTGLDPAKIVRAEGQGPVQPRPQLPYATFKFRRVAIRNGRDAIVAAPEHGVGMYRYTGERGFAIDVMCYGNDQDEAYTLAAALQFGLDADPVLDVLRTANLSVWDVGDVLDLTEVLGSGYEARALLECNLWVGTDVLVDLGQIDSVPVVGDILSDAGDVAIDQFTVNLN